MIFLRLIGWDLNGAVCGEWTGFVLVCALSRLGCEIQLVLREQQEHHFLSSKIYVCRCVTVSPSVLISLLNLKKTHTHIRFSITYMLELTGTS